MDESARWLWSQGRTREAVRVVSKASRLNFGQKHSSDIANFLGQGLKDSKESAAAGGTGDALEDEPVPPQMSITDLFKTPNMCKRMFNVSLNW